MIFPRVSASAAPMVSLHSSDPAACHPSPMAVSFADLSMTVMAIQLLSLTVLFLRTGRMLMLMLMLMLISNRR